MARKPRIDLVLEELIVGIDIAAPPTPIGQLLAQAYERLGVDAVDAADFADAAKKPALARLELRAKQYVADGRSSTWRFNPSDPEHVQGDCFVMAIDSELVVAAKQRRKELWDSLDVIEDLDPLDFEALCQVVLEKIGVRDLRLTPRRADQGIDFFGKLAVHSSLLEIEGYPPVLDMLTMWVVGQAKRFQKSQVATFDLRELVGSVQLARAKAYGLAGDRYPDMDLKVADPVIALFFTSGQVSREARILARRSGVVALDGELLAHLLAWARVGFDDDDQFSRSEFMNCIASARGGDVALPGDV